jgi:hypothetical protein
MQKQRQSKGCPPAKQGGRYKDKTKFEGKNAARMAALPHNGKKGAGTETGAPGDGKCAAGMAFAP